MSKGATRNDCPHHHIFFLVFIFILSNVVPIEYAEGKQTSYACEGSILRLDCDPGRVIHLIRAIYGRFSITICNENGNTEWSVNCGSPKSILVLNGTCNYQRSCSVLASTMTFGDPCPGTVKYLEVQYQCISERTLLTSTTPKSLIGRPNLNTPWLTPSNPNEAKGTGGLTNPDKGLLNHQDGHHGEGGPDHFPSRGINQSNSYDSSLGRDFEVSSILTMTSSSLPTTSTMATISPSTTTKAAVRNDFLSPMDPADKDRNGQHHYQQSSSNGQGQQTYETKVYDNDEDDFSKNSDMDSDITDSSYRDWMDRERGNGGGGGGGGSGGEGKNRFNMDVKWPDRTGESEVTVKTPVFPTPPQQYVPQPPPVSFDEDSEGQRRRGRPSLGRTATTKEFCPSKSDRGMFWNWTGVGLTAKQPCPDGASGVAKWKCIENLNNHPATWYPDSPDLSDCKSVWLGSLQGRVLDPEQIPTVLAGELAQVTNTKKMYGGDIAAAVKIMKTLAARKNEELRSLTNQVSREDLAAELLQLILDAGSNLLEKSKLDPWRDLSYADKMANATGLLVGLEDNAFLLANVISNEKILRKSAKNILTTIYAIEANNVQEINFPSESTDQWGRLSDVLTMPAEALRENSDGGLVRLVCFAYNNLEHVLQPIEFSENEGSDEPGEKEKSVRKRVNSRVISASLNQGRHIQLALPVHLTFRHLWLDNVSNPQCVFWDYTLNAWSEEGCRVVRTNRTHTECQCTHLTNFAILMDLSPPTKHVSTPQILQVVIYIGSAVVILCLVFTLIITHFCIHGKVFQTMILKNLFLCMIIVEIIFVFGISKTEKPWLCTSIALIEHYFALASILWLFLHGFHLHLIVVEAAESGLSRQLWYYGVSYGSPLIVVLLSFLLDPRGYRSEKYCWIQTSFGLLCFVGPAIVVAIATAGVLAFTSYRVCGLLSAMPKKPNDDKALYLYAGTWLRGSLLILVFMTLSWTLRLIHLDSDSVPITYAANLALAVQGIAILVFHILKSEDIITKICDCGRSSGNSDTEMSTHSQQQLQASAISSQPHGGPEACHSSHLGQQRGMDGGLLTLNRQGMDPRTQESLYAKQLGIQPSPGGMPMGTRYGAGEIGSGVMGLYGKGNGLDGNWTRGSSYSDIRSMGYHHRNDPVYEEIEKPMSPRASISDLSEDEMNVYLHDPDVYNRSLYGQQQPTRGTPSHYHHHRHYFQPNNSKDRRKGDIHLLGAGEAANPLLNRNQHFNSNQIHQMSPQAHHPGHYTSSRHHQTPTDHLHHVSLKGHHRDEHILQNVHMV